MRTLRRPLVGMTVVALSLALLGPSTLAQYEDHPYVGTWLTDEYPDDPDNPHGVTSVAAAGTIHYWSVNGPGIGTWRPTGERSFEHLTLWPQELPEIGFAGYITIRMAGEVDEDGQTATGTWTIEFPAGPEGVFPPPGVEFGPAGFVSTRVNAEPQGEPVGPWPPLPPTEEEAGEEAASE